MGAGLFLVIRTSAQWLHAHRIQHGVFRRPDHAPSEPSAAEVAELQQSLESALDQIEVLEERLLLAEKPIPGPVPHLPPRTGP
jgi:hypothetical protein